VRPSRVLFRAVGTITRLQVKHLRPPESVFGQLSTSTRAWLITGPPGIGKSTVVAKAIYMLRSEGHGVGGCLTRERKEGRERVGFTISDLMSGREGELAAIKGSLGPRVGRYRVNVGTLASLGARALHDAAVGTAEVIVIDEIGPMELTSPEFKKAAEECFKSGKPILAVVHQHLKDPLIETIRENPDKVYIELTLHNREKLAQTITNEILAVLPKQPM
jgi:nucleoside-triphosphatase